MRSLLAIACALTVACAASPASFDDRVEEGNRLLEAGDTQAALDIYRDLQIDRPDSGLLQFNMGVAKYDESEKLMGRKAYDEAVTSLQESRAAFEKAVTVPDFDTRSKARFSIANTLMQEGKALAASVDDPTVSADSPVNPLEKHQLAVAAYENAISEFENLLKIEPDNKAAKLNRAHARYELKKLLQNPPQQPPPSQQNEQNEQQQDQGEGEGEQGQNQQQNQGDQEGDNQQSQQQQGEQQSDRQEEQDSEGEPQGEGEQQPQPGEEQQSQEEEPFDLGEMQERDPQEGDQQQPVGQPQEPQQLPPDNIEALLQSIESQDNRELADDRKRGEASWPTRGWW